MSQKAQDKDVPMEQVEAFFVNNVDLNRISAYLNRFNPIKVMRMESMEIRHSAILAWLLDPAQNHGLSEQFLRAFLTKAVHGSIAPKINPLEIYQADLRYAQVEREKRNIDIFISVPSKDWNFVIENKWSSAQYDGQLTKYLTIASNASIRAGKQTKIQGILLSLNDEVPNDDAKDSYVTLGYADILEILSSILDENNGKIALEVRQFIEHYMEILGEKLGMSSKKKEMEAIAQQLYRTHKSAIDFILKSGVSNEFSLAAESLFGEGLKQDMTCSVKDMNLEVMYHSRNDTTFSFLPVSWRDALGGPESRPWEGCETWWAKYPVICWFRLIESDESKGKLFLYGEVGPLKDNLQRKALIEKIQNCATQECSGLIKFRANASNADAKFSKFFVDNNVAVDDINDKDTIETGMKGLLIKFSPVFDSVAKALEEFIKEQKN